MENQGMIALFLIIGLGVGLLGGFMIYPVVNPPVEEDEPEPDPDLLEVIQNRTYMIVGTASGWPPFEMVNTTTSELYGFDIDLCEYIADYLNVTIEWRDMDFDALVGACSGGTIDMIAAATFITPERNEVLTPSVWYLRTNEVVVVKANSTLTVDGLDDLDGLHVGVQTGTVEADEVADHNAGGGSIIIHEYPLADTMFIDLNSGALDAIYIDEPVLTVYEDIYAVKGVYTLTAPPTALYMPQGHPDYHRAVNNAISIAFEEGLIDEWIAKWFG